MYDVVIIGGGPAGLSSALVLGRCRRRVVICDDGTPRNAASRALHGFLTRDGIAPMELIRLGQQELLPYEIESRTARVTDVTSLAGAFEVVLAQGDRLRCRTLLIATGVQDQLPDVPGIRDCYGISVHHCPYCDGWEVRDKSIAVVGHGAAAAGLGLSLKTWSDRIAICTSGFARLPARQREQLSSNHIPVHEARIVRVEHDSGWVRRLVFADGRSLNCDAVFFTAPQYQQSELARKLGCEFNRRGTVKTDHLGKTCVPGIYVVGDASRDVQFAIVAAAEGAKAGVAINKALQARAGLVLDKSA